MLLANLAERPGIYDGEVILRGSPVIAHNGTILPLRAERKPNTVKVYGRITVFPIMPARINRLYELAYNLWWSWHPEARALYSTLDPELWEQAGHNPVRFLSEVRPARLEEAAADNEYLQQYDSVIENFDRYI